MPTCPEGSPRGSGPATRSARRRLVLVSLLGIAPKRLHALAWAEGTASGCLAAIRSGAAGSEADRGVREGGRSGFHRGAPPPRGSPIRDPRRRRVREAAPGPARRPADRVVREGPAAASACPTSWRSSAPATVPRSATRWPWTSARRWGPPASAWSAGRRRGIDAAAHRGALAAGGTSIAVLGSGIDLPYPKGSAQLLERIAAVGAVVTEYAPGVKAEPFRFPARNRIVAALSRGARGGRGRRGQRLHDLGGARPRSGTGRVRGAGPRHESTGPDPTGADPRRRHVDPRRGRSAGRPRVGGQARGRPTSRACPTTSAGSTSRWWNRCSPMRSLDGRGSPSRRRSPRWCPWR